ncbi:MAG: porin [Bacteroidota bacterium]
MKITKYLILVFISLLMMPDDSKGQGTVMEKYTFGNGFRFVGESGYRITMRGFVQPSYDFRTYTDTSLDETLSRFRMRRVRFRLDGNSPNQRITWRLQVELSGNSEADANLNRLLMDAWIGYQATKQIRIRFGQKNTPTDNRELLMRSQTLQLVERSRITSAFGTIREFGLFIDGNFKVGQRSRLRPSLVITTGEGDNVYTPDLGGLKYGGRLDFLPFGTFVNLGQYHQVDMMRELTPKLVFGVAYSVNEGMSSRRGRNGGDILYFDADTTLSLPDYSKFIFDFIFKYKGFSAIGEFVSTSASVPDDIAIRQRNNGSFTDGFDVDGERDVENYVKGRMMLGRAYNIQMGYLFKNRISVDSRYTFMDADEHSFLNNGTFYNRPQYYTFGLTKFLSKNYGFKIQGSVTYVEADEGSNDLSGNPMDGNEWLFRFITSISF